MKMHEELVELAKSGRAEGIQIAGDLLEDNGLYNYAVYVRRIGLKGPHLIERWRNLEEYPIPDVFISWLNLEEATLAIEEWNNYVYETKQSLLRKEEEEDVKI